MMCLSAEDLRHQANWDGAEGHSRQKLLLKISHYISPSIMVPEHRLATLLHQHKDNELENCKWHNGHYQQSFFIDHHCDRSQFPYYQAAVLKTHADEVYTVQFSHDGQKLASAGNDKNIIIWDVEVHARHTVSCACPELTQTDVGTHPHPHRPYQPDHGRLLVPR